jgi:hypothetical protein
VPLFFGGNNGREPARTTVVVRIWFAFPSLRASSSLVSAAMWNIAACGKIQLSCHTTISAIVLLENNLLEMHYPPLAFSIHS